MSQSDYSVDRRLLKKSHHRVDALERDALEKCRRLGGERALARDPRGLARPRSMTSGPALRGLFPLLPGLSHRLAFNRIVAVFNHRLSVTALSRGLFRGNYLRDIASSCLPRPIHSSHPPPPHFSFVPGFCPLVNPTIPSDPRCILLFHRTVEIVYHQRHHA